ncbi:MAG TPA: hypothetical protein VHE54_18875 [Puia sp.]|nr:hypothetical protein [Puia sp.]
MPNEFTLEPIGSVRSPIKNREDAPKQGYESAPEAWIELKAIGGTPVVDIQPVLSQSQDA